MWYLSITSLKAIFLLISGKLIINNSIISHHPQHWQHHSLPLPHQSPAPLTPHACGHGLLVSPWQPLPPPLQPPSTPPAGVNMLSINARPGRLTSPLPSARLNSRVMTFVPGHGVWQSKVIIKDPLGQEVNLTGLSKKGGVGANLSSPVIEKNWSV